MTTTSSHSDYQTPTQAPARAEAGRTVSIVGIVLGALAILFGLLTGIPGLVCSIVGAAKGNRLGWIGIVVSVLASIAGAAIGVAILKG